MHGTYGIFIFFIILFWNTSLYRITTHATAKPKSVITIVENISPHTPIRHTIKPSAKPIMSLPSSDISIKTIPGVTESRYSYILVCQDINLYMVIITSKPVGINISIILYKQSCTEHIINTNAHDTLIIFCNYYHLPLPHLLHALLSRTSDSLTLIISWLIAVQSFLRWKRFP